jgi:hypothetical protein
MAYVRCTDLDAQTCTDFAVMPIRTVGEPGSILRRARDGRGFQEIG